MFCLNPFYLASWLETGKASIPQIIFSSRDLCVNKFFRISLQDPNYRSETIVYRRTTTTDPYHNTTEQFLWLCSCVVSHHWCCEFKSPSGRLCDTVCQWLATGWWFSPGLPVSFINKTDCHDIAEILLKVALNTIKQTFIKV